MDLSDSELEELRQILSRKRTYASLREGGTKEQKELGVVRDLLESMEHAGKPAFLCPEMAPKDPPDCIAQTASGQLVAVEVTEFVSQEAVELNERSDPKAIAEFEPGAYVYADWRKSDFLAHLARLLMEKDGKTLNGGPYARYVVVVHSDEPFLLRRRCEGWLEGHSFGPFSKISEAYLLYPYEPDIGYPYARLELR